VTNTDERRRRRWPWVVAGIAGLLVGVGIGAAGKTRTMTVTVEGKTTAQATAPVRTVTKVVVHTHTPAACNEAITEARRVARVAGSGFDAASKFPPLVAEAATAAEQQNVSQIESISSTMQAATNTLNSDASTITSLAIRFDAEAAACG
jgi:hypothetical protein